MTRFTALLLILFCASAVFAQKSNPKIQIFGGYSLQHTDNGGLTSAEVNSKLDQTPGTFSLSTNYSGWNAQVQYNLNHWLGVAADFAGHYGNPLTSSNNLLSELPKADEYSIMFGPVLTYKNFGKITPFVHVLGGLDRQHQTSGSIPGLFGSSAFVTDWAVAVAAGGGIDYKLYPHFTVRVGQFDYVYTGHDLNKYYANAYGPGLFPNLANHENNLRFSTGIVVKF